MSDLAPRGKPRLRGYIHQEAFFISLGACILLIAKSTTTLSMISTLVYSFGLLVLFGISATYHRPMWPPKHRAMMKRFDHCAIFILIAGTFTPFCLLALSSEDGHRLLSVIWGTAFVGILQSFFWPKAPKWFTALFYVIAGWMVLPYISELKASLGETNLAMLAVGGVVYTIGAVAYAMKKPHLRPAIFGYHEFFHVLTIIGAAFHFFVIYQIIH